MSATIQEWIDGFEQEMRRRFDADIRVQVTRQTGGEGMMYKVTRIVAECTGIDYNHLVASERGDQFTSDARMVAMYFIKKITAVSIKRMGMFFGGRNHSTVLHGIDKVKDMILVKDAAITELVEVVQEKLNQLDKDKTNPNEQSKI